MKGFTHTIANVRTLFCGVVAVLLLLLAQPQQASAQCDVSTINQAKQLLVLQNTDSLVSMLTRCLDGGFKSNNDIFSAYLLIGKAYIAEAEADSARKYVKRAVRINRSYSPTSTDESQVLLDLVALAKKELEKK